MVPGEEDPEAIQVAAAAGAAHLRRVVHLPAHQLGAPRQGTALALRLRPG